MNASKRPGAKHRAEKPAGADPAYSWALLGVLGFAGVVAYVGISAKRMVASLPASPVQTVMHNGLMLVAPAMLFVAFLAAITLAMNFIEGHSRPQPTKPPTRSPASRQPGFFARTMKPFARKPAKKGQRKGPQRKRLR